MHFSVTELLLIAFIAIVLFGSKKVRMLGGDIGHAIRDFRHAMQEQPKAAEPAKTTDSEKQSA
ncbi:twin-arginine translocase TatA/TatE family subunit [Tolumonas lignilytica]|uniref:twin-arginine translocase TatA/TatE family subunit n=1 Tax=Tolumonas lignilytica TaxID=1283284 RepID=UPI000466AE72|nr:twin-arginine translocase TatA/TatE family subunit [Tolumonas lignilytica]